MRFTPKTENEIRADGALPEGDYDFEVLAATEKLSKAGNDMIELKLNVFGADGSTRSVRDWIVADAHRKLRGFCEATGLLDKYEHGELEAADLEGRAGRVRLKVETGDFAGNKVAFYLRPGEAPRAAAAPAAPVARKFAPPPRPKAPVGADLSDDIPF